MWHHVFDQRDQPSINKRLQPLIRLRFIASILFFLVACTGTQEIGVPRLLILGHGENSLTLVQDLFFADRTVERFQFSKELTLPGKPLAYDIVDRRGSRETLVVLSQSEADSFITFYNLEAINPDAPDAFAESKEAIALSSLENLGELELAPTQLQVDETGRYLAIMHSFDDPTRNDAFDIIDTRTSWWGKSSRTL